MIYQDVKPGGKSGSAPVNALFITALFPKKNKNVSYILTKFKFGKERNVAYLQRLQFRWQRTRQCASEKVFRQRTTIAVQRYSRIR
jgi:hypothetical protein